MPNGGFGCAYCVFYTKPFCNLRNVRITKDHWTICVNVQLDQDVPIIDLNQFDDLCGSALLAEAKGSIYAITSDEGAYIQVPWLEDGEIHVVNSMRSCVICQKSQTQGKGILFRSEKYFFCSYAHYLSWRNKQIVELNIKEKLTTNEDLQYFYDYRDLKIIKDNTTEDQRNRANERDSAEQVAKIIIKTVTGFGLLVAALMVYYIVFK
jgi:hypothetical protein